MTDKIKLLPCPFCGGAAGIEEGPRIWLGMRYGEPTMYKITHWCNSPASPFSNYIERKGKTIQLAADAWNTRFYSDKRGENE